MTITYTPAVEATDRRAASPDEVILDRLVEFDGRPRAILRRECSRAVLGTPAVPDHKQYTIKFDRGAWRYDASGALLTKAEVVSIITAYAAEGSPVHFSMPTYSPGTKRTVGLAVSMHLDPKAGPRPTKPSLRIPKAKSK